MLYGLYVAITIGVAGVLVVEIFQERRWKFQLAMVLILLPLVLRILHIK